MVTMQKILNLLTGKEIYYALIEVMTNDFGDFADSKIRYENALHTLQTELCESITPSAQDAMDAIQQQTISNLIFSGVLGLKANLDNFINPLTRNFLDVDYKVFLREDIAHRLPKYERAQIVLDQFYALLSPDQQTIYEDVITYICHLETIGPKLAHYYGYLLGNELLPHAVPGYHSDMALTAQYRMMLRNYFGKKSISDKK